MTRLILHHNCPLLRLRGHNDSVHTVALDGNASRGEAQIIKLTVAQEIELRRINGEKERLLLVQKQLIQDLELPKLADDQKKLLKEKLLKIKNKMKGLHKKSRMVTLSTEEIAKEKARHANRSTTVSIPQNLSD